MSFFDMLNKPLPSAKTRETAQEKYVKESEDMDETALAAAEDMDEMDDIDLSEDEIDALANMSDDELDEIANNAISSEIDDIVGEVDDEDLSPEEERDADDMMGVAATAAIIQDELNSSEKRELMESMEQLQIAIDEGLLMESDVQLLKEAITPFTEAAFANKTKVKFSLADKKAQLYAIAINVSARAHGDSDYYKLQKIYKAKRLIRAKLEKKYHAEATKRLKVYIARLKSSKSGILSGIGKKISGE